MTEAVATLDSGSPTAATDAMLVTALNQRPSRIR